MRAIRPLTITLLLIMAGVLAAFLAGAFGVTPNPTVASTPTAPVPAFKHIFVIMLENKAYDEIVDSSNAAYIAKLAHQYALASQFYGVGHPSLPNYIALTSGDTFGITRDCNDCFLNQPNLADQIEASGRTWKGYMESMPSACFVGDAPPLYRQKHNPFIYYDSIRNNPARCARIVPFSEFASDLQANTLPDFVWITPNMCNDGHDCPVSSANAWLEQWIPQILASPAWKDNGALFLTFDEGEKADDGGCCQYATGGRIATLVISPLARPGYESTVGYTHYSLLRTIESAWQLAPLGHAACDCSPTMADFFTKGAATQ